mgnify:CR=1 FL=1
MIYDLIAPLYDRVNGHIDYEKWADFIEEAIKNNTGVKPILGLDLGSGTGRMTITLAKRGYDMTGVDYSADMLAIAHENAEAAGYKNSILWLCQDITEFELYGTVDFAVCCLDTVNHLTSVSELRKCFSLVHNYLVPDGLFIFDINCRGKFERIYANNTYAVDDGNDMLVWRNYYNEKKRLCDFEITLFKESFGAYERFDEVQTERMYTLRTISSELSRAGFEFIGAYSDFSGTQATDSCERAYIIAKCIKSEEI